LTQGIKPTQSVEIRTTVLAQSDGKGKAEVAPIGWIEFLFIIY
jgi:hypothetical protein